MERFTKVGTLAGIRGEIDDDGDFAAGFNLRDDPSQMVFARCGIPAFEDKFLVVASLDALLEALDPAELENGGAGSTSPCARVWRDGGGHRMCVQAPGASVRGLQTVMHTGGWL